MLSVIVAILAGLAFAVQGPTNTRLAGHIGNLPASAVSFGGGIIFLGTIALIFGDGDYTQVINAPWWTLSGGIFGACMVIIITLSVPLLGMAMTVTIIMTGQLIMGMVIDTLGLLGSRAVPVDQMRIIGCLILIAGLILVYIGKRQADESKTPSLRLVVIVMASFLAGAGGAIQASANSHLADYIGKLEASSMNFTEGLLFVLFVMLIQRIVMACGVGKKRREEKEKISGGRSLKGIKPWMLLGGVYGGTGVCLNVIVTPIIGVALLVTANLFGEIGGGMFLDMFGILTEKIKMNKWRYAGMLLIFIGVFMV